MTTDLKRNLKTVLRIANNLNSKAGDKKCNNETLSFQKKAYTKTSHKLEAAKTRRMAAGGKSYQDRITLINMSK